MSSGPVIAAMRRWPSSMRCRVAARPPDQFAEPTDGRVGRRVAGRVDDDERDGPGPQPLAVLGRELGEDEHDADRPAPHDALDPVGVGRVPAAAHREHDAESVRLRDRLDAVDELHRPDRVELVEDELDELGLGLGAAATRRW